MNKTHLVGRLTKEPEVQYTKQGTACMQQTVAIDRGFGDKKKTDFIPIVLWRQQAEYLARWANKGSKVAVSGLIQSRDYEKDGQKVFVVEVLVEDIEILDKFKETQAQQPQPQVQPQVQTYQQPQAPQQPAYQQPAQPQVQTTFTPNVNIEDDDLPF